jgi:hypothetical protein
MGPVALRPRLATSLPLAALQISGFPVVIGGGWRFLSPAYSLIDKDLRKNSSTQ